MEITLAPAVLGVDPPPGTCSSLVVRASVRACTGSAPTRQTSTGIPAGLSMGAGGGTEMLRLIKSVYVACHSRIQSLFYHHCIIQRGGSSTSSSAPMVGMGERNTERRSGGGGRWRERRRDGVGGCQALGSRVWRGGGQGVSGVWGRRGSGGLVLRGGGREGGRGFKEMMLRLIKSVYVACHSRLQSLRCHHCIIQG